jgi:branched-chain amino acid transport system substrate-binding protein
LPGVEARIRTLDGMPVIDGEVGGDNNYLFGTQQGQVLEQVLRQCGDDLSRENIVKQARSIRGLALPTAVPGVVINTGPDGSMAYTQLQLQRWNGSSWEQFGDVLSADSK